MTKHAIALIYKRSTAKSHEIKDKDIDTYIYTFKDFAIGTEESSQDKKEFIDEDNTKYPYIEDINCLDEKYVYAFPYYTTQSKDKLWEALENADSECKDVEKYILVHLHELKDKGLKTIAIKEGIEERFATVDPSLFEGYYNMISSKFQPFKPDKSIQINTEVDCEYNIKNKSVNIFIPKTEPLKTDEMFNHVTKSVICQDDQVRSIVTGFAKNQRITAAVEENPDRRNKLTEAKQNFFICGPTGVGKTAILRSIAECANVPITFEDATRYTMEGYVGESPENILKNLLRAADYNIQLAQRGIIVVDEIDKKASSSQVSPAATTEVQSSFLTMMAGQKYPINISNSKSSTEIVNFDTSTVTFAFLGAYSGIEQFYTKDKNLGFGADVSKKGVIDDYTKLYSPENLIKYGMISEFLGRANIVSLRGLDDVEAMTRIILESDKSPSVINKELYSLIGINLILQDAAVKPLAEKAISYKAGARGIKKAFDEILGTSEFEIFSSKCPKEIIITPESIEDPKKLLLK
jgi:ATP-dependent Clp protease ATP-binding subunit ClpX